MQPCRHYSVFVCVLCQQDKNLSPVSLAEITLTCKETLTKYIFYYLLFFYYHCMRHFLSFTSLH